MLYVCFVVLLMLCAFEWIVVVIWQAHAAKQTGSSADGKTSGQSELLHAEKNSNNLPGAAPTMPAASSSSATQTVAHNNNKDVIDSLRMEVKMLQENARAQQQTHEQAMQTQQQSYDGYVELLQGRLKIFEQKLHG